MDKPKVYIEVDAKATPFCDIYVERGGERTIFGKGFVDIPSRMPSNYLEKIPLSKKGWFTTDSNHGEAGVRAVTYAHNFGMHIYILDLTMDPIPFGAIFQTSTAWFGTKNNVETNIRLVNEMLLSMGQKNKRDEKDIMNNFMIVTDGKEGFVGGGRWYDGTIYEVKHFPCFHLQEDLHVDSTGAGDSFRAAMLYGLGQKWSVDECFRLAAASGALACCNIGGSKPSTWLTIQQFIEKQPNHITFKF